MRLLARESQFSETWFGKSFIALLFAGLYLSFWLYPEGARPGGVELISLLAMVVGLLAFTQQSAWIDENRDEFVVRKTVFGVLTVFQRRVSLCFLTHVAFKRMRLQEDESRRRHLIEVEWSSVDEDGLVAIESATAFASKMNFDACHEKALMIGQQLKCSVIVYRED